MLDESSEAVWPVLVGVSRAPYHLGAVITAEERRESIEPKQGLEEAGDRKLEAARATAG